MIMTTTEILELLEDDMVSHGFLAQCLSQADFVGTASETRLEEALKDVLATKKVEIGLAKRTTPDYVEFVAWKGTIDERVKRALEAVANAGGSDKEFAYWLCLRENVDRFEGGP
jgi:hypothetical protein